MAALAQRQPCICPKAARAHDGVGRLGRLMAAAWVHATEGLGWQ
jgi:hypothetical protein